MSPEVQYVGALMLPDSRRFESGRASPNARRLHVASKPSSEALHSPPASSDRVPVRHHVEMPVCRFAAVVTAGHRRRERHEAEAVKVLALRNDLQPVASRKSKLRRNVISRSPKDPQWQFL